MRVGSLLPVIVVLGGALLACKRTEAGGAPGVSPEPNVTAPAANAEVTFQRRAPKAGTRGTVVRTIASKVTMQNQTVRDNSRTEVVYTVKTSDEHRVLKADLDVKELYSTSQTGTNAEKKTVSPLSGSVYTVTRSDDGKLSAQDSGGSKVASSLVKLITEEFSGIFDKNEDTAFLPDRPLKLGEKFVPPNDALVKLFGAKDDGKTTFDGSEFILKEIGATDVTFTVSTTLTQKFPNGLRLRMKLMGSLVFIPNGGWATSASFKGPLTVVDTAGKEKGSGDFTFSFTQAFDGSN
ncbi:MAG: hypothetical protein KIT72_07650 [Polyangiaceae bacterium]|nr:hypothetical protein [Polyangiaceae bacterium]MCW5790278.1 hypothetical protein [Polyangiaceae bacterium]